MERFNLTRYDLLTMSWTELMMMFDATYEDGDEPTKKDEVRRATEQDWKNWL